MAVTTARMMGWRTKSFREKSFFHYRHLGTAERSVLSSLFSYGEKDYYLGGHPVWELFRIVYRVTKQPYIIGGLALGAGYCWACLRRTPRPVSPELMAFHRREQMAKLKAILNSIVKIQTARFFQCGTDIKTNRSESPMNQALLEKTSTAVGRFCDWLDRYGETSYDHQSFFASELGRGAKALYYRRPLLGTLAVAPSVFCEAFVPSARGFFWKRQRFPIADAHYAMGFALLAGIRRPDKYYQRAVHFLEVLQETRCPGYEDYCWGYPFDWETRTGTIGEGTPLITTVPYVYEAFSQTYAIDGDQKWLPIMRSIAEHALQQLPGLRDGARHR